MKRVLVCIPLLLVSCGPPRDEGWLGYVDADVVMVAPPQPGWVTGLGVQRGAMVKPGEVLFTLDSTTQEAARANALSQLATAQAAIVQMKAEVEQTAKELERQRGLVRLGATPRALVEQAQAAYEGAVSRLSQETAQVDAMRANLQAAEYNLDQRVVRSRVTGRIEDIFFRPGEYAGAGAPVLSILPPNYTYVRFFIPEGDIHRVATGRTVTVGCDGCPPGLSATITFIASDAEYTPPVIYSVENRAKLVFKAEARGPAIAHLRPGLPVSVVLVAQ